MDGLRIDTQEKIKQKKRLFFKSLKKIKRKINYIYLK